MTVPVTAKGMNDIKRIKEVNEGANKVIQEYKQRLKKPRIEVRATESEIVSKNFRAYYGKINDEWIFKAQFDDTSISIPFEKLKEPNKEDLESNLLKGIAWLFMKYKLM